MRSGRSKSASKVTFKLSTSFHDNKIKAIDKQKEESLRWHISKIEKLRNKKWKSLEGIPPPPPRQPIRSENRAELPPDVEVTRATSFYAWDESNPSLTKSIITTIKPPAELTGSSDSGEVSFTEVTRFYKEGEMETYDNSNNTNSLLILYPQDKQDADASKKVRRTHIYIPHVNRDGRVVRPDTPPVSKAFQTDSFDSLTERDSKQTNLERFKACIEKRAPKLGAAPRSYSFPETNLRNKRPSILSLVNKIEKTKTEITAMRLRSNSRLSKALRKIGEESRVIPEILTSEVEDEAFLISLDNDPSSIPNEQCVARVSSILEREDRAQDTTLFIKGSDIQGRRQTYSELQKRREEFQPLLMTDMEDHHYVRRVGSREEERHDVTCGCNKYHGLRHSYSEVEV